jgi:hypothetical protein
MRALPASEEARFIMGALPRSTAASQPAWGEGHTPFVASVGPVPAAMLSVWAHLRNAEAIPRRPFAKNARTG